MSGTEIMPVAAIKIGKRYRKDMGDIPGLASSIEKLGLLHRVVVAPDNKLIVGRRRLEAYKHLERDAIPVIVAHNLAELKKQIDAQNEENTCRKDFLPSEGYAIAKRVAKEYKPTADAAKKEGKRKGGKTGGKGRPKDSSRGTSPKAKQDESKRTGAVAAKAAGVDRRTLDKTAAIMKSGDKELIAEMDRTGRVAGVHKKLKVRQAAKEIEKEPPPLPDGRFRVIVADPPWHYGKRAADPSHRTALPYPSMSIDDIAALPIADRAHDDSILWLWTTYAHIPEAWKIIDAWGFTYKTMLTWVKNKMGTGDWLRGKTEHCLLCVRGKPTITLTNQTTVLEGKVGEHSAKPVEFYDMVETLCPGSKLELFQRTPREGWQGHGNEVQDVLMDSGEELDD